MQSSWAIEGEILDNYAIRSQLVQQLGLNIPEWIVEKRIARDDRENRAIQAALLLLNTKGNLSLDLLKKIHGLLEDNEYFGELRTSSEVVGRLAHDHSCYEVIFEAPEAEKVPALLEQYFSWWRSSGNLPAPLGAALAQLYFVEIHPFTDGNRRIHFFDVTTAYKEIFFVAIVILKTYNTPLNHSQV